MVVEKKRMKVSEAALELEVSEKHIYRLLRSGVLSAITISESGQIVPQSIRISAASVLEFIKKRQIPPDFFGEMDDQS